MQTSVEERDRFLALVLANHWNASILERLPKLGLAIGGDPDTSWEAEDAVISRTAIAFSDLPISVQIRNQARVPLWYEEKFGIPYPPVYAASDGIDRFPCGTVSTGIRRVGDEYRIHAPFGLGPLLSGTLIPNAILQIPDIYAVKTGRWREVWPDLVVEPWPAPAKPVNLW